MPSNPSPLKPPRRGAELAALGLCAFIGVLISVWPHLVWWPRIGVPYWLASNDDLLYLSIAAQAYHEHPFRVGDPTQTTGGATLYPQLQLVPGIVTARLLGLGPLGVSLVWRVWTGFSLALGFYLIARLGTSRPRATACLALLMLLDCGFMDSRPVFQQFRLAARVARNRPGELFDTYPQILRQDRIITPGLSLIALALHVWLLQRARARPSRRNLALSGLGFGLLFHTYFYYWTGAALALALTFALDRGHRAAPLHTAWIGALIGLPEVVRSFLLKQSAADGWPMRTDKFLPISHTAELLIHKEALVMLALTFVWVWSYQRRWLALWALAASGWLLANHSLITGLQIENDHWAYVRAPSLTFLLMLLVIAPLVDRLCGARRGFAALAAFLVLFGGIGFGLRHAEVVRSREPIENQARLHAYRRQRVTPRPPPPPLVPNSVLAGERGFVDLAAIQEDQRPLNHYAADFSPSISDAEWDARYALNAYLLGVDRAAFEIQLDQWLDRQVWGAWGRGRSAERRAERRAGRLAAFDEVVANPNAALDRFAVRYLALPSGRPPPDGWTPLQHGPTWDIWERR